MGVGMVESEGADFSGASNFNESEMDQEGR
jgi:hypothetical protein